MTKNTRKTLKIFLKKCLTNEEDNGTMFERVYGLTMLCALR